jgi:hypothetical protein
MEWMWPGSGRGAGRLRLIEKSNPVPTGERSDAPTQLDPIYTTYMDNGLTIKVYPLGYSGLPDYEAFNDEEDDE